MRDQSKGVRGYKQIHLKKFSRTISHNLKLLALSREINLYELHGQIIAEYINGDTLPLAEPQANDQASYNVFVGQEALKRVEELSSRLDVPESEIFFSALVNYADKYNLSQEL
ncbi:hypothetical protein [Enterobacter hormaechei]|uniref:hypothetical protein n=1 Tax=Enterobacter hormaechei TaxID=158836 RepID=UPI0013D105F8|nr:hypothetical protein [Enterobacter hormaechei]EDK1561885.1 hypothetical protein [Salmonella enterica subsp. enterica serovar Newport]EKK9105913.1 hypothetical protein [Salmonella enterica]